MDDLDTSRFNQDGTNEPTGIGRFMLEHLRMQLTLIYRYKLDFFGQIIASYVFFALIFFGGTSAIEQLTQTTNLESGMDSFIVGWFLLVMVQTTYTSPATGITQESRFGTLEQLYITPYGFGKVILSRMAIQIFWSMISGFILLLFMILTTNQEIEINVFTVVVIVMLTLLSVVGVGLILAGLALVYKKVNSIVNIIQFAIIGLIGAPLVDIPALRYLPVAQGSDMLQRSMTGSMHLWEFPIRDSALLCIVSIGYFVIGYAIFQRCLQIARVRGVMGHY